MRVCVVLSLRAIESVYREYCEKNSKEWPKCLDSDISDDLMLTDSAMWAKVHNVLFQNLICSISVSKNVLVVNDVKVLHYKALHVLQTKT